ncbi:MAG: hypothetical protein JEZ00_22165 [Anaerolineaceae bacterium]|nr:hypothetical protein [Anaerolineaceae bacterium]
MGLNKYGEIAQSEWLKTPKIRQNIELGEFVIMPNHLHGIIIIKDQSRTGTVHRAHTHAIEKFGQPISGSIPTIIRSYKATVTKQINILRNTFETSVWHRNFYEHVICNEKEYEKIATYIINIPLKWYLDRFYSSSI